MATISEQWTRLLDRCLERRVRGEQFSSLVGQLYRRTPIFGAKLADILVTRQDSIPGMLDPLLPMYAEILLQHERINSSELLAALYRHSKSTVKSKDQDNETAPKSDDQLYNTTEFESAVFDVLARAYLPDGNRPQTQDETRIALILLAEWLVANVARGTALVDEPDHQVQLDVMAMFESFGALSIAMLENARVAGVISALLSNDVKKKLAQGLTSFVQFWSTAAPQHAQTAARLDLAQKSCNLIDEAAVESQNAAMDVSAAIQIDSVVDMQIVHTRPHIFIFVSSLLAGCPLTDESMMMSYLHTRYGGDAQSLAIDLIFAGFDGLAAAADRNESKQVMFTLKSFLLNKIPMLLVTLTDQLLAPELVIQQALSHIDLNVFPTVGLSMLQSSNGLQDTRQDFVYSCILHGLLVADSVGRLLAESTFDSPPSPSSRLHKDILSQQCQSEPGKAVQLVANLEKLDGNAGAIVGAVVDSMRTAALTKDTMSLKSLCNAFAGKPEFLDLVLQFVSPATVLQPLCQLLDAWKYEDDHGESQPVYEEFSSVFLFVLTFIYRFEFTYLEMGISKDSFVAKYMSHNHQGEAESQRSEEQSRHLASWVTGLYDSDGIPEEVTASCQPQQFYVLVPTIISQTVLACSTGVLSIETIGNGLEYLSEPFLLPSLVGAVHWLAAYAREYPGENIDIILQILQRITKAPTSSEAQAMHSSIMAIITLPLTGLLRSLEKKTTKRNDIAAIAKVIHPHREFRRGPFSPCLQMSHWTSNGGLQNAVKITYRSLINWSLQLTTMTPHQLPPSYNQRLFLIAEYVLSAPTVLRLILQEIKEQTEDPAGAAAVALDIATALICAPKTENSPIDFTWPTSPIAAQHPTNRKRLNLREALALEMERTTEIIKNDTTLAESIVRLHRLVEAQANLQPFVFPDMSTQLPPTAEMQQMLDSITNTQPAANNAAAQQAQPTLDLPQDMSGMADLGLGGTGDAMQIDFGDFTSGGDMGMGGGMGGDDDVFGDLDLSNMDMDYGNF